MLSNDWAEIWKREAIEMGATHIIRVCDTFSYEDYPVFVMQNEELDKVKKEYDGVNMQKIEEIIEVV